MRHLLAIDARWLKTGIGRYTLLFLRAMRESLPEAGLLCITHPEYLPLVKPWCDRVVLTSTKIYTFREQMELPQLAQGASLFFAPHYNAPLLWSGRLVVTIHDLTHLLHPSHQGHKRFGAVALMGTAARRAHRIITPSHYTRTKLVEHLGVRGDKITVIPGCVGAPFRPVPKNKAGYTVACSYGITRPYLLYVGNLAAHKNLAVLFQALSLLRSRGTDTPLLVIATNDSKGKPFLEREIQRLQLQEQVVWLHGTPDVRLAELYAAARMTIMPSREEGFGLPVIESMACGTPVICSRSASLPEVAGDAALYFDADSPDELSSTIAILMHAPELERQLTSAGLMRAQLFSPAAVSQRHVSLIRSVLAGSAEKYPEILPRKLFQ